MERDRLVGRTAERQVLRHTLTDLLHERRPATLVVAGDPGIGKTRLLGELAAMAAEGDVLVLEGRASEFELFPFGVLVDALDDYVRSRPAAALDELGPAALAELALVLPSMRHQEEVGEAVAGADDRVRAYVAIRALLGTLAAQRPLMLVLDDLHWADRGSLELLAHLLRRPPSGPVLLAAAYRRQQVDPEFAAAVARAADQSETTYLELGPLDLAEAARLVEAPREQLTRLHQVTGGNPFYLLQLARSGAVTEAATEDDLPPAVARAIVSELDPLTATTRALAVGAAVAGDPFDFDLATAAAALSDEEAFRALDDLAAHGLVRPTDVPRRFTFRHPLVREAIYQAIPPGTRLLAHVRCTEALARLGAEPAVRAPHVEHAARPGDLVAVDLLATAAEQAAARAPSHAARWLRTALRLLPADADPAHRHALLRPLPDLLVSLGEPEEAHATLLECLALGSMTDLADRVALATRCATLEQGLGRHEQAHRRLADTLEALPAGAGREAVSVMIALMMDGFYRRRPDEVRQWGDRAATEAARIGDILLEAAALATGALADALSGSVEPAERRRADALALLPRLSDDQIARRLDVLGGLAGAELYLDRYEDAARHAERGLRLGRTHGTTGSAPTLIPTLGTATWVLGRTRESVTLLDEAVEQARAVRDPQTLAWHLFNLGLAQVMAGEPQPGRLASRESVALARSLGDSVIVTWAGAAAGLAELEAGDPQAALAVLLETGGGPELPNLPGGWRANFLEVLTRCQLALGRLPEAEKTAETATSWATSVGLPYGRAMADRALAACALVRGEAAAAADLALAAAEAADGTGALVDGARSRTLAGRALAALGRTDAAVDQLERSAAFFDACGSLRFRDEAELELGRLGRRPHRRTRVGTAETGPDSLTAREREVADLVVRRHTNAEIAELLFLSGKTVETHLRNVFRKLGVTSRADVARTIEAQGAAQSAAQRAAETGDTLPQY